MSTKDDANVDNFRRMKNVWNIIFKVDSLYACGIIAGKFHAKENKELVFLMMHLWKRLQAHYNVRMIKIKSHTGIPGNDEADFLADLAGRPGNSSMWWKRPYVLNNWGDAMFREGVKLHEKKPL